MNYSEIRKDAREDLKGKWGTIVFAYLVVSLIMGAAESLFMFSDTWYFIGSIAGLLVSGPLNYGFSRMVLKLSRREKVETGDVFAGFNSYSRTLTTGIDITVRKVLWSFLFIIPGIVASYSYSMTYYIMADNPKLTGSEAINKSKEIMKGHRLELFVLELTFIGWSILALIFTLGIGLLWVSAYQETAKAEFYKRLTGAFASTPNEGNLGGEEEQKIVNEDEVRPYSDSSSDATIIYNLKCPNCGAKEIHTQNRMECPYCSAIMKEDK